MLTLALIAVWFGVVAIYLVRQWWVSELAQVQEGVPASAPVALPAAPEPQPERRAPAHTWSRFHATAPAAR
jgi:hypothetical protein